MRWCSKRRLIQGVRHKRTDKELVVEIAKQVAQEQILFQWPLYVVILALSLIVGFGSAYIGGYARKRGENFATKSDFDEILVQLEAQTKSTEQIKIELSHTDWAARELRVLRRVKLEELLQAIHELQEWQSNEMSRLVYSSGKESSSSPAASIERLSGLYFPDLKEEILPLLQLHREAVVEMLKTNHDLLSIPITQLDAIRLVRTRFAKKHQVIYEAQLRSIAAVEAQCRELMEEIISA